MIPISNKNLKILSKKGFEKWDDIIRETSTFLSYKMA